MTLAKKLLAFTVLTLFSFGQNPQHALVIQTQSAVAYEDDLEVDESTGDDAIESDENGFISAIDSGRGSGLGGLMIPAALPIGQKQNFVDSVQSFAQRNNFNLYEAGQPLSRIFEKRAADHCSKFVKDDGTYGPIGLVIERVLTQYPELEEELMTDSAASKAGMRNVCPRFTRLSEDQRKEFWVWVMASLALFESTCGFDTSNPANRNAVGMYQLHASKNDRKPRALANGGICGELDVANLRDHKNNTFCALDFIRDSFSGRMTHAPPGLITRAQQFERLRDPDNYIIEVIKLFRPCQPNFNDNA